MLIIFHLIGAATVGAGVYVMTNSILLALIAVIVGNGAPFLWFIHNLWYVFLELFRYGHLTIYGYSALTVYILVLLFSYVEYKRKMTIERELREIRNNEI